MLWKKGPSDTFRYRKVSYSGSIIVHVNFSFDFHIRLKTNDLNYGCKMPRSDHICITLK